VKSPAFSGRNEAAQSRIYFVGPPLSQKQPRQGLGQVRVLRQVSIREVGGADHRKLAFATVSQKQMFLVARRKKVKPCAPNHLSLTVKLWRHSRLRHDTAIGGTQVVCLDASTLTLKYVTENLAALTLIGTLLSSAAALLFLYGYLWVFDRELIWTLEYTDLPKVILLGALLLLFIIVPVAYILAGVNEFRYKSLVSAIITFSAVLLFLIIFLKMAHNKSR
jgi:hypothetical protein